jgi:hypothetical protein
MSLLLKVESYAGYQADERPLRFTPQTAGARTYEVREVLDRWYGVGHRCFKVLADDGAIYVLKHIESDDIWTLEAFRAGQE